MPGVRWSGPISMNCLTTRAIPITHGLMASIPRLEDVPKSLLKTIRVRCPPARDAGGVSFSNRCPHATPLCVETALR